MVREIANKDLKAGDVPDPGADWGVVGRFALSFNGYEHWGSFERCADVASRGREAFETGHALPDSLTELRTCLFFEQRRWRHYGYDPDERAMGYIRALVGGIRERIRTEEGA
jgi:hypothetical protein